jgi:hypothetical protein
VKRGIRLGIVIAWLAILWTVFVVFQYRGLLDESPWPRYLVALVTVIPVLLVSAGLGSAIAGRGPRSASDMVPFGAVGLAVFGIAAIVLGRLGLLRPYVLWLLLGVCAVATRRRLSDSIRLLSGLALPRNGSAIWVPFAALGIFAAGTALIGALAPLTANDALVYHLNIPKIYAASGGLVRLPYNVYANMPHYGEMLYTVLYSMAGEAGAKLFYFFMLLAASGAVYALAGRIVNRRIALVAAVLFLVHPLVIDHRIICNVDVMLAYFYLSAAILLLEARRAKMGHRHIAAAALAAGFMLGMKYTALVPCATLLAIPALSRSWVWKRMLMAAGIAVLVFVPWLVKNEAYMGNPVYPLLESTFDGENWSQAQSTQLIAWQRSMGMGRNALDYLLLPLNISTRGKPGMNYTGFDGTLSPVLLVLLPLALFKRRKETDILMVMGGTVFVFWAITSQQLRFLLPAVALAAVLAGAGLENLRAWTGRRGFVGVLVLLLLVQISSLLAPGQYGRPVLSGTLGDRLPVVQGLESRSSFLRRSIQSYSLFEQMNENIPPGEPVFLVWENRGYYLDRPYFADSFFEASTLMTMVAASQSPEDLRQKITAMGYRYVVVNDLLGEFFSKQYPSRSIALLEDFIAEHLSPVHSVNRLTLYSVKR